ncbi:MAG: hypothetical protein IJW49_01975 [Clostridia bacterium]|nr:hypothetical protein [Clostridia bacterium]
MKFQKNQPNLSPRQLAQNRYNSARANLLLVLVFTVINIVLAVAEANLYFLFSATVPYYITIIGQLIAFFPEFGMLGTPALVTAIAIAAVLLLPYLLCWIFSKKSSGWMIGALVCFSLDTLILLLFALIAFDTSMIADLLFHAWVIYYLILGIKSGNDLKKLPVESEEPSLVNETDSSDYNPSDYTPNT